MGSVWVAERGWSVRGERGAVVVDAWGAGSGAQKSGEERKNGRDS
jgi:hypothetical protein